MFRKQKPKIIFTYNDLQNTSGEFKVLRNGKQVKWGTFQLLIVSGNYLVVNSSRNGWEKSGEETGRLRYIFDINKYDIEIKD